MELHPDYPVVTTRLRLRPLTLDDVDALLVYRGRSDVCRYLPFEPMTPEVLRERLDGGNLASRAIIAEGGALTLGAELDGRLIGDVVLFFHSRRHRSGEIGYVFDPAVHGHGYATEACAAMLALAFDDLGLHRVVARLDARNEPSARLATRLGMRLEAHLVRNEWFKGEWTDELIFAIVEDEWSTR